MSKKYLGKENAQELAGAAVILRRAVSNGLGQMPAGTKGIITNNRGFVRDGKLAFRSDRCSCCGLQWHVAGLHYADLELVKKNDLFTAEQLKWCDDYEAHTGFEPLMDEYLAGNESFVAAARRSIVWYEDHSSDALLKISNGIPGMFESITSMNG